MKKKWQVKTLGYYNERARGFVINREHLAQFNAECKLVAKDKMCRVIVTEYDPEAEEEELRSIQQNKYYHLVLDIICDHTGDNHMSLHEDLKIKLLGKPYVYKDREVMIIPSTTQLTTKTFGDYLEKVFKFASEDLGIVLPSPNQYYL